MNHLDMSEVEELHNREKYLKKELEQVSRDINSAYKKLNGYYYFVENGFITYHFVHFQRDKSPYYEEDYNHGRLTIPVEIKAQQFFKEKKDAINFQISDLEKDEKRIQKRKESLLEDMKKLESKSQKEVVK